MANDKSKNAGIQSPAPGKGKAQRASGKERAQAAVSTLKASAETAAKRQKACKRLMGLKIAVIVLAALIGFGAGTLAGKGREAPVDRKTVAFRIGAQKNVIDYDMLAAADYLDYLFRRAGYEVIGRSYAGDLYPERLDGAGVNVFVRGFVSFFDLRMNERSQNVYYMHRFSEFFEEELRGYGYCLSSQKRAQEAGNGTCPVMFLPGGFVPHERLEPDEYAYDVLYIYEYYDPDYDAFIQRYARPKVYGGAGFAKLSAEERAEELRKARLVVYDMSDAVQDDAGYVPYAAYDIISYGRPLLTDRKTRLEAETGGNAWLFGNPEEMKRLTAEALNLPDGIREQKGAAARELLREKAAPAPDLLQKLRQMGKKSEKSA